MELQFTMTLASGAYRVTARIDADGDPYDGFAYGVRHAIRDEGGAAVSEDALAAREQAARGCAADDAANAVEDALSEGFARAEREAVTRAAWRGMLRGGA